jgi:hypothetical protein
MFEVVLGVTLLIGLWARQGGLLAFGLYTTFTLALASVLIRGMDVDCGCFGGLFGDGTVSWGSIALPETPSSSQPAESWRSAAPASSPRARAKRKLHDEVMRAPSKDSAVPPFILLHRPRYRRNT